MATFPLSPEDPLSISPFKPGNNAVLCRAIVQMLNGAS